MLLDFVNTEVIIRNGKPDALSALEVVVYLEVAVVTGSSTHEVAVSALAELGQRDSHTHPFADKRLARVLVGNVGSVNGTAHEGNLGVAASGI